MEIPNLIKPEKGEKYTIDIFNSNSTAIEKALAALAEAINNNGIIIDKERYNTAVGQESLKNSTDGCWWNTALGYKALNSLLDGAYNVALGQQAMNKLTVGGGNTAIGSDALSNAIGDSNTPVEYNIAVGGGALGIKSGRYNVALGDGAGGGINGSDNSVFIGAHTGGYSADNQTNQIVIGFLASGGGSNTVTLGNNEITQLRCQVTAITALSDSRTKEYATPADLDLCVKAVKSLPVSRYKYEDFTGTHLDKNVTGFLADDVEKVFPKSVSKSNRYFPVLDENGEKVYEEITETKSIGILDENGQEITKEVTRKVEKMFLMEDVKEITMTEAVPTIWGALQSMIERVEELERKAGE